VERPRRRLVALLPWLAAGCAEAPAPADRAAEPVGEARGADQATQGSWAPAFPMPVDGAHAQLLPSGRVLYFGNNDGTFVWDPASGRFRTSLAFTWSPFGSGHAYLPDGRLLVVGGANNASGYGTNHAALVDLADEVSMPVSGLPKARFHPSAVTLPSGDVLVVGGTADGAADSVNTPTVYRVQTGQWEDLVGVNKKVTPYPHLHVLPSGEVFISGPDLATGVIDTSGTGTYTDADFPAGNRFYGTSVQFTPGQVLALGGSGANGAALASAEVIDFAQAAPKWVSTGNLAGPRQLHSAVLLPDGKVLVVGGSSGTGFNKSNAPVLAAESWDPATGQFTTLASSTIYRGFQSIALLLPDGRVLSSSGLGFESAELFSPPYLFAGPRPTLTSAPESVDYGETFEVETPDGATVANVALLRLPSTTQQTTSDQRRVLLSSTPSAKGRSVTLVAQPALAPPGPYLLFLLDAQGVPSVGRAIRVGNVPVARPLVPRPPRDLVSKALGVNLVKLGFRDDSTFETGYSIERTTPTGRWAQVGTTPPDATSFSDTDPTLVTKTTYYYRVRALGPNGPSPYSSKTAVVTP
jgi:hypothetical protein